MKSNPSRFSVSPVANEPRPAPPDLSTDTNASLTEPSETGEPVSLASGTTWISGYARTGLGALTIENGTSSDAVAAIFDPTAPDPDSAVRAIYVKAGETTTMAEVGVGTYSLRFTAGKDFDESVMSFRSHATFTTFIRPLEWSETQDADGTVYTERTVTLHAVPLGNAPTQRSNAEHLKLNNLRRVIPR